MRKLATFGAASAFALAGAAHAQLDWGVISTTGDPDPITVFDLSNPGGSNANLGFVDGNFNRGMDFDSPTSFYYYVSTDTLNDTGDRGLWRWDNGINTQLATQSFSDSGDGDATLSNDRNTFYVSTSDGDAIDGDSIYAFQNITGAVSHVEIGETGLSQLIGIAMHPITNILYGYDSSTEALYTIDTSDASTELVGFSGSSLGAIGGMDFNADGSILLLSSGDDLFTVDINDGSLEAAGNVGLNTSALSYRVPAPSSLALLGVGGLAAARRRRA